MKLREVFKSPNYYCVCESDRSQRLVLHVVAGGVLMYEVVLELLPEEEEKFRAEGHLDSLAGDVRSDQDKYWGRILTPLHPEERLEFVEVI
jgi:hypothetical protein